LLFRGANKIFYETVAPDWRSLAIAQEVKTGFAEYKLDLSEQSMLLTLSLRYNGSFVMYDSIKQYVNITANLYLEDQTKKPIVETFYNHKQFRLCTFKDYKKVGEENYIQGVLDATG